MGVGLSEVEVEGLAVVGLGYEVRGGGGSRVMANLRVVEVVGLGLNLSVVEVVELGLILSVVEVVELGLILGW